MPTGSEIRETFLRFFEKKKHKRVHSSSLVPANDPTLLFTNAGMNQFKDVFLGLEKRDYNKATSSQKCVRAGGKHNDLENVGFTKRHHTFFEMLGNFSFGDYFKKEAIAYAWELLTSKDWFGIDKSKLYLTVFQGEQGIPRDDEAEKYWLDVGAPKDRVFALGMKDNFWAMGETGPCGPCSEIYYDMGPEASEEGHTDCKFPCECGRYVEFWNLVFMQFDRDASGTYNPLPKPSVDTGMGLERTAAVLQGVLSNYATDLFTELIKMAYVLTSPSGNVDTDRFDPHATQDHDPLDLPPLEKREASLRIIADHSRACTFLISDGVLPANEGRGYVLRKILRRGIRHGRLLGQTKPFMCEMVYAVCDLMKDAYPELVDSAEQVYKVIHEEERRFSNTLGEGLQQLEAGIRNRAAAPRRELFWKVMSENSERKSYASQMESELERAIRGDTEEFFGHMATLVGQDRYFQFRRDWWDVPRHQSFPGSEAFKLYDTFGLPFDFIMEACRDAGISLDVEGFERAMAEQRERARASWKGGAKQSANPVYREVKRTEFVGYNRLELINCFVLAIIRNGAAVPELLNGQEGEIVLDRTPFYADSGGQVGDVGWLMSEFEDFVLADVHGCYQPVQGVRSHRVTAKSRILANDRIRARVNINIRQATMRNHTATHLLHAGLREVLGKHVKQAGSLVDPQHLRFDFSHFAGVADEELQDIEDIINKEVLRNIKVETIEDVPIDVAVNEYHAMALFGEKYGDRVRVVKIGDFSTELCGGTHTATTGEIGLIKILDEGSVSSGVRRVEAVTGEGSLKHFRQDHQLEHVVSTLAPQSQKSGSPADALRAEWDKKESEIKKLQKELEQLRMKSAASTVSSAEERVREIKGVKVLAQRVDNLDRNQMRTLVDNLRNKLGSGVVVLGCVSKEDGKVALIVGVTKDLTARVPAGKVIKPIAEKVGGSGGGRPDMAEAGGKDPEQLDAALAEAYSAVEALLK
jgi:alanyl-tRNA synthetase